MENQKQYVMVLNCGSSSIKFAIFDMAQKSMSYQPLWNGKVQGIGGPNPDFGETDVIPYGITLDSENPYRSALSLIRERVLKRLQGEKISAVAHRVVHGGNKYFEPIQVDENVLKDLKSYIPLAPLHQPFALEAVDILLKERPDIPQVVCFDTAFHHTIDELEQLLPLPYEVLEVGLRKYGFHGLSYEFIAQALKERHGKAADQRTIVAHLGSGASLCAMKNLKSVASTMGFSSLDGLMMGTRTGALDPGAIIYLMEIQKLSLEQVGNILYHHSGLLGVSGISSEPRVIVQYEKEQTERGKRARLALDLFVRRIVKEIGALTMVLGGLDRLIFTAGIGEHSAFIRERVCRDLAVLGVAIDEQKNQDNASTISTAQSKVHVGIELTNEEWIVANHTKQLLNNED